MWYIAFAALWVLRGGTMSDQQPAMKPTITGPPLEPVTQWPPPRTIHDVEADLALAGLELAHHRKRRGDTVNNQERLAQRPALLVHELNALLDEWSGWR